MRLPRLHAIAVIPLFIAACSSPAADPTNADGTPRGGATGGENAAGSNASAAGSSSDTPEPRGGATSSASGGASNAAAGAPAASGSGGGVAVKGTSCKRGLAYGHHSVADLQALSKGVSWWYNWDFRPDEDLRSGAYLTAGVEYVPMIWGAKSDRAAAKAAIGADATALLGFNEPNFGSQANLSAQDAAKLWPEVQAIADAKGLRLVSPAVNFCGGDCQDTDPFHYLDAFFAACSGCRVDAIAIHIYVACTPSGDNKAEYLIQHIETYKKRFTQPLWLTEFACDSAKNATEQQAFLEDALTYLEAEPRIERYAWFSGRATNVKYVDLLADSGQLTPLGQAYVNAPRNAACTR